MPTTHDDLYDRCPLMVATQGWPTSLDLDLVILNDDASLGTSGTCMQGMVYVEITFHTKIASTLGAATLHQLLHHKRKGQLTGTAQ